MRSTHSVVLSSTASERLREEGRERRGRATRELLFVPLTRDGCANFSPPVDRAPGACRVEYHVETGGPPTRG